MSFGVDVNILLYASDESSAFHETARRFIGEHASGTDIMYLAYATVSAYLRMATHARIFRQPLTPSAALSNVRSLAALPNVRLVGEEEGFLEVYRDITAHLAVRGNLVPDAHLAAVLRQHGIRTIYTNDLDFRRFTFLTVCNPFS